MRDIVEVTAENLEASLTILWSKDRRFSSIFNKKNEAAYEAVGLPAGDYAITTQGLRDFEPLTEFSIKEGESKSLELTFKNTRKANQPRAFAHLRVVTPQGVPLPGAELSFDDPNGRIARKTEQAGQITLWGEAGEYQVTASFPGFEPTRQTVKLQEVVPGRVGDESGIL